jgi:hypothetical protein
LATAELARHSFPCGGPKANPKRLNVRIGILMMNVDQIAPTTTKKWRKGNQAAASATVKSRSFDINALLAIFLKRMIVQRF